MYFYEPVITQPCKRCGGSFESRSRAEYYCGLCKSEAKKEMVARNKQKREAKRQKHLPGG